MTWCSLSLGEILNFDNTISDLGTSEIDIHVDFIEFLEIGGTNLESAGRILLLEGSQQTDQLKYWGEPLWSGAMRLQNSVWIEWNSTWNRSWSHSDRQNSCFRLENVIIWVENEFFMWGSSICCKHDGKWWEFDEFSSVCRHRVKTRSSTELNPENIWFWSKFSSVFSSSTSARDANTWATSQVDFSTHVRYMDKPSWGPTDREKVQTNLPLKWVCNNPRHFLF